MHNRDRTFFSLLNVITIGFLVIVLPIVLLTAISGFRANSLEDISYDAPLSAQELISQKSEQGRAASKAGFSSQHRVETVYPKGWELPETDKYSPKNTPKTKGFFYVEKDFALIDMQIFGANLYLSAKSVSVLFGLITIVLTVFAVSALSVPFVRILEKE
jgi:hypothetical protein